MPFTPQPMNVLHSWKDKQELQDHHQQDPAVDEADDVRYDKSTKEEVPNSNANGTLMPMVVNLVDSQGHIEFDAEVSAALHVSDAVLLLVVEDARWNKSCSIKLIKKVFGQQCCSW
jgi:predicted membrane GTPase involved in stress response